MVRRVIRLLELPVSLSLGVVRESASLAGRIAGRLLTGGGPSEPPPPPPPAPSKPARTGAERPASRTKPPRPPRPKAPTGSKAGGRARRDNGTEQSEASAATTPQGSAAGPEPPPLPPEPAGPSLPEPSELKDLTPPPGATLSAPQPGPEFPTPEHSASGDAGVAPDAGAERPPEPHSALNNPVGEPDPTEWPDPYERRADPRDLPGGEEMVFGDEQHPPTGATSTSEPHPSQDPEAEPWEGPSAIESIARHGGRKGALVRGAPTAANRHPARRFRSSSLPCSPPLRLSCWALRKKSASS